MHYGMCSGAFDLRVQKIGDTIRTFKRVGVSGSWKTNTGTAMLENIPTEDRYKLWAELASKLFGGLSICTVDVICAENGTEYIMEVNGTSSGLCPEFEEEDNTEIKKLVLAEMDKLFCSE